MAIHLGWTGGRYGLEGIVGPIFRRPRTIPPGRTGIERYESRFSLTARPRRRPQRWRCKAAQELLGQTMGLSGTIRSRSSPPVTRLRAHQPRRSSRNSPRDIQNWDQQPPWPGWREGPIRVSRSSTWAVMGCNRVNGPGAKCENTPISSNLAPRHRRSKPAARPVFIDGKKRR